ncbi:MAG: chemotaxis protein CheW [Peptococcaceae bacterium]|jgi:purine-binding chemotaxis protein CheW|nr:chemotaxis protein CheW [Peptococcaceae bacterium]MDH7523998.1 chemotaxis protein CheW [Peptococcaceae bacterium]
MPEKQFVVFKLGTEEYAVPIFEVREIIRYGEVKKLPDVPDYMEGIINLRGNVVPVVNLSSKFGLTTCEGVEPKVIVSEIGDSRVGIIVDEVTEVLRLSDDQIEPPPFINMGHDYIKGIGKVDDRLLVLLSLRSLFTEEELHGFKEIS